MVNANTPSSQPEDVERILGLCDGRKSDTSTKKRRHLEDSEIELALGPRGTSDESRNHTDKKSRRDLSAEEPTGGATLAEGGQLEEDQFFKDNTEVDGTSPNDADTEINRGDRFKSQQDKIAAGKAQNSPNKTEKTEQHDVVNPGDSMDEQARKREASAESK